MTKAMLEIRRNTGSITYLIKQICGTVELAYALGCRYWSSFGRNLFLFVLSIQTIIIFVRRKRLAVVFTNVFAFVFRLLFLLVIISRRENR